MLAGRKPNEDKKGTKPRFSGGSQSVGKKMGEDCWERASFADRWGEKEHRGEGESQSIVSGDRVRKGKRLGAVHRERVSNRTEGYAAQRQES